MKRNNYFFRGKDISFKDEKTIDSWLYGNLVITHVRGNKKFFIVTPEMGEYSSLSDGCDALCFDLNNYFPVDPESIGQFTGLFDGTEWSNLLMNDITKEQYMLIYDYMGLDVRNWKGIPIFEGDIIDIPEWFHGSYSNNYTSRRREVVKRDKTGFYPFTIRVYDKKTKTVVLPFDVDKVKVRGNIYDNPDLIR